MVKKKDTWESLAGELVEEVLCRNEVLTEYFYRVTIDHESINLDLVKLKDDLDEEIINNIYYTMDEYKSEEASSVENRTSNENLIRMFFTYLSKKLPELAAVNNVIKLDLTK